jgi:prohibitin 2
MDPREQFERIQRSLQNRGRGLGGGAAGPGGRAFGGIILLGAAAVVLSNSLFNGLFHFGPCKLKADCWQSRVATVQSSILDSEVSSNRFTTKVSDSVLDVQLNLTSTGTHFRIPWFETPIDYDVRARPRTISSLTGTKDLQMVRYLDDVFELS